MNIIIGGDLVPTSSNEHIFSNGDVEKLLGKDLYNIWRNSDIRIFNLEVPLTDVENPINKCGPNLIASTRTIKGIKALNPNLITLSNNHILDQGESGLKSTEDILNKVDIPFVGIGDNIEKARKPYIIESNDKKIGIYACAENEFTIATEYSCGANPFDPLESLDDIVNLKGECDYVIVLYHGGKEHYRYPSPYLQKICRKIVEKGADLVICQHSHCIGAFERYKESNIIYGQGNFIFDGMDIEPWRTSLLINVTITNNLYVDYIPIIKQKECVRLANKKIADDILNEFYFRSNQITQPGFIDDEYRKIARESLHSYIRKLSSTNKWISRIDRILLNNILLKRKLRKQQLLSIQNIIECEAHRELILCGLLNEYKN